MMQDKFKDMAPRQAYEYGNLHGPTPELEDIISTSAKHSYHYAHNVLNNRFPIGERAIATSAEYSYLYAYWVLDDRFYEGERVILTDSYNTYNPYYTVGYIINVMRRRWLKAESSIRKSECWDNYKKYFNIKWVYV